MRPLRAVQSAARCRQPVAAVESMCRQPDSWSIRCSFHGRSSASASPPSRATAAATDAATDAANAGVNDSVDCTMMMMTTTMMTATPVYNASDVALLVRTRRRGCWGGAAAVQAKKAGRGAGPVGLRVDRRIDGTWGLKATSHLTNVDYKSGRVTRTSQRSTYATNAALGRHFPPAAAAAAAAKTSADRELRQVVTPVALQSSQRNSYYELSMNGKPTVHIL